MSLDARYFLARAIAFGLRRVRIPYALRIQNAKADLFCAPILDTLLLDQIFLTLARTS
jgi:hypothetical protein